MQSQAVEAGPAREWALYARVSNDRADGASVDYQIDRARTLATVRGVGIRPEREYVDLSISASAFSRKPRPAYRRLLEAAQRGELAGVIVFKLDRLYRRPAELEEVIPTRLSIVCTDDSDCDLGTASGQLVARMVAAVGANEVSSTSIRLKARRAQLRERGIGGFTYGFGWRSSTECEPGEMALIREAMERVVAGASLTSIAAEWNRLGIRPKGRRRPARYGWTVTTLRQVLENARHAGLLAHRPDSKGRSTRPATILDVVPAWREANAAHLVPVELREEFCAVVDARRGRDAGRRRWLSGVVLCGRCGAVLHTEYERDRRRIWKCLANPGTPGCGRFQVVAEPVDEVVREAVLAYVDDVDLAAVARQEGRSEADEAAQELARIDRARAALYADVEEGLIGDDERRRRLTPLRQREEKARRRLTEARTTTGSLAPYAGRRGALRRIWPELTEGDRRELVRAAFGSVTVLPATVRGPRAFTPDRVVVAPRLSA